MLTRLTYSQISAHWEEIKKHLEVGLVPFVDIGPNGMNNILQSMMTGDVQVWLLYELDKDEQIVPKAMATTAFIYDQASKVRNLLIYSLSGYDNTDQKLWLEGMDGIKTFALSNACKFIVAYSSVDSVTKLAKHLGANTEVNLITWRL